MLTSCLALSTPASAAPAPIFVPASGRISIGDLIRHPLKVIREEIQKLEATLKDPVKRRHLVGKLAVGAAMTGLGEAIDIGAKQLGLPPVGAGFLASSLPTYAQYYAQLGMAKLSSRWFERPKPRSNKGRLMQAGFAGVVGAGAVFGVHKLDHLIDSKVSSGTVAAVGRVGAAAAVSLASAALNSIRVGPKNVRQKLVRSTTVTALASRGPSTSGLLVPASSIAY